VRGRAAILAAALLCAAGGASAEKPWVATPAGGDNLYTVRVRSLVEMRFEKIVRQAYDLSCGAAALATLLTYFYGHETSEREVIERAVEFGDAEKISRSGFSMLELKKYAQETGYVAEGFGIPELARLEKITIPYITLISVQGYSHFVVVKTIRDGKVYLADPAYGNRTMSLEAFDRAWQRSDIEKCGEACGVVLGVMSASNAGDAGFALAGMPKARSHEVQILTDFGLRQVQIPAGVYR
jgi:predicted double-glycine peptidase